ncbi:MAG: hypothetical protein ACRDGS_11295 [Chloroflexota bacterium]
MDTFKYWTLGISEPFMRLVYEAFGRALAARQGADSFLSFLIVQPAQGEGSLMVLATDTAEEAIVTARLLAAQTGAAYYVLAYDGFVTDPGAGIPRTPAVCVEAYERSKGHGVRFGQRYMVGKDQEPIHPVGNPIYGHEIPMPSEAEYKPQVERYESARQAAKIRENRGL